MHRITIITVFWIALVLSANASSIEFPVTPESLDQGELVFSVSTNATQEGISFRVTIAAKTNAIASDSSAYLRLVTSESGARSMRPVKPEPQVVLQTDNYIKRIEQQVPELACVGATNGTPSSAQVWQGEEYASAGFVLRKNPRYHAPNEVPRARRVPLVDFEVTIARYASAREAQQAVEKGLRQRPAMTPPKGSYKGATLYRYTSGGGNAICQYGPYIVEVAPYSEASSPLTMKVLDVVLGELKIDDAAPATNAPSAGPSHWQPSSPIPPIAEADPSRRSLVSAQVPSIMQVMRDGDFLTVRFPTIQATNLMVGHKMVTGIMREESIDFGGKAYPLGMSLQGGAAVAASTNTITLPRDKLPPPGQEFTFEHRVTVFETDLPAQHMWSPQSGKLYKVLWTRTFRERFR